MSYNGWPNRATWLVMVWFNPESKGDVVIARMVLEQQYNAMGEGVLKDMIQFESINWKKLESSFDH